uniref:Putative secreted peptide n=1 Tax=Anopheles braziliensis TaxID=58242 RepID=A0A2M3ZPG2_9DIPT
MKWMEMVGYLYWNEVLMLIRRLALALPRTRRLAEAECRVKSHAVETCNVRDAKMVILSKTTIFVSRMRMGAAEIFEVDRFFL